VRFFGTYGLAWGCGYYLLAATGVIAPIVAWLLSNSWNTAPNQQPPNPTPNPVRLTTLWTTVGFWTAVAAIATGLNSLLGAQARYENAWEAHDYLFLAGIDYRVDSRLDDKFLSYALRTAHEIFARKQRPPAAVVATPPTVPAGLISVPSITPTQPPSAIGPPTSQPAVKAEASRRPDH
jgi:hypothetical protein